ncbi:DNA repair protein crb2 [Cytospora mali]|uniref:DNA repair protein crb2 n=1 Tax=Cytospora mali TaxID=578113 RepID=A0A194VI86_CYTMA|nr:DNA repair protein crb2 [Valsa mali]
MPIVKMGPKVPNGQTLAEAEKRALRGDVESQDSQLFLEQYHRKYAPGLRSSSPSQPLPPEAVQDQLQQYLRRAKVHQTFAGVTTAAPIPRSKTNPKTETKAKTKTNSGGRSTKDKDSKKREDAAGAAKRSGWARTKPAPSASISYNQRASSSRSPRHLSGSLTPFKTTEEAEPELELEPEPDIEPEAIDPIHLRNDPQAPNEIVNSSHLILVSTNDDGAGHDHDPRLSTAVSANSTKRKNPKTGSSKMETSQSPTQSNDGRSYEQYLPRGDDLVPTDAPDELEPVPQHSEHTPTPHDDSRSLHEDDTGAVNFDNIDRYDTDLTAPDTTGAGISTHDSSSQLIAYPETPAPQKNPFAGSKAHLLASSQMFRQTQVSSACKALSPTSSRPSPDNFQLQDLFSPNNIISSPLKNFVGPSPLQVVTSSPQVLPPYDTSPQQALQKQAASDEDATDSTPFRAMRKLHTGLMEAYTPMRKSRDRKELSPPHPVSESDSDDDVERRRYRAMLKRLAAEKQLGSINYERPSATDDMAVPSTNTVKDKTGRTDSQVFLDQCEGRAGEDAEDAVGNTQEPIVYPASEHIDLHEAVIDDSQAGILLLSPEHATRESSNAGVVLDTLPNTACSPAMSPLAAEENSALKRRDGSNGLIQREADAIPDTSPARLRPIGEMLPHSSEEASKPESFSNLLGSSFQGNSVDTSGNHHDSLPDIRSSASSKDQQPARDTQEISTRLPDVTARQSTSNDVLKNKPAHSGMVEATETGSAVSSSPPVPAAGTKSRLRGRRGHIQSTSPEDPTSSVSTLSVLTTTPEISNKTTPLTQESPPKTESLTPSSSNEPQTSPAVAKANRRRGSSGAALKSKTAAAPQKSLRTSNRRSSRSFPQHASVLTDELVRSPSSSAPRVFEQSMMLSRLGRTSLREAPASRESSRGSNAKILAGMAFAISFQARQPGEKDSHYNSRIGLSSKIADKIKQAGGNVLTSGFDQLFEFAPINDAEATSSTPTADEAIKLTTAARNIGFTALIADGHSRKVKYMQALALGLPCIHERWITTCVEKQTLVDWSDYLLCAGNSSFLGDAIRSRNMPSYDVASAKLSQVIKNRPQLLRGSRILLVLRKQDESKKMAYVFLARVLGASLSRVYNMDEARKQLKASEDTGHPYNWVYVDEKMAARAHLFPDDVYNASPSTSLITDSKKRKRKSVGGLVNPPPKRIRTLSDELVIQSLILGRLIEESEIHG